MLKILVYTFCLILISNCSTQKVQPTNDEQLSKAQDFLSKGEKDKARLILSNLCKENFGPGCAVLGGMNQQDKIHGFVELYQKACDLKDGLGCYGLASIQYKKHESEAFKKNLSLSCQYGFQEACKAIKTIFENNLESNPKR